MLNYSIRFKLWEDLELRSRPLCVRSRRPKAPIAGQNNQGLLIVAKSKVTCFHILFPQSSSRNSHLSPSPPKNIKRQFFQLHTTQWSDEEEMHAFLQHAQSSDYQGTFFGFFSANLPLLLIAWTRLLRLKSKDACTCPDCHHRQNYLGQL